MLYMLWSNICSGPQVRMQYEPYMHMVKDKDPECIHTHHTHTHTYTHTHTLGNSLDKSVLPHLIKPLRFISQCNRKENLVRRAQIGAVQIPQFQKCTVVWCVCVCLCVHKRMQAVRTLRSSVRTLRSSSVERRTRRTFRQITD